MTSSFAVECGPFLVSGLAFLALGSFGMETFLACDYINGHLTDDQDAGYTKGEYVALLVGVYFLPISFILLSLAIAHTYKGNYADWLKFTVLYPLLGLAFFYTAYGWERAKHTLNCGVFCFGPMLTSGAEYPAGKVWIGMMAVFCSMGFEFFLLVVLLLLHTRKYHEEADNVVVTPLLGAGRNVRLASNFIQAQFVAPRKFRSTLMAGFVFFVLYPILFFACITLPTWWNGTTEQNIRKYQHSEPPLKVGFYWSSHIGDNLVVKIFPDIVLFYGMIYLVSILAFFSNYNETLRRLLHYRFGALDMSLGEVLVAISMVVVMVGVFLLYYLNHGWQKAPIGSFTHAESTARALGQVCNVILGYLLLPISKNSVWTYVFGVSWESMLRFHRYMGGLFALLVLCHMFAWWKWFSVYGSFPHDIFSVPQTFHPDNFTVPLIIFTTIVMLVVMIPAAYWQIRRRNYDLFLFSHYFFFILIFAILWHATQGWYYITGGLLLWTTDRALRMFNCIGTNVKVTNLSVEGGNVAALSYVVYSPIHERILSFFSTFLESSSYDVKMNSERTLYKPINHEMGQYCFLNIPTLSMTQWHPFTISSAPFYDAATSHHIKSMGASQWTGAVLQLANEADKMSEGQKDAFLRDLIVIVDGPYGVPIPVERYEHILLIGGGIGVTPLHSHYRFLYHALRGQSATYSHIKTVKLIWTVRDGNEVSVFEETVSIYVFT